MDKIKVAIIDDHALVRSGIKSLLANHNQFDVIGEASSGESGITLIQEHHPDVAIVDIRMGEMSGIEMVKTLRQAQLSTRFLMLSMHDSSEYVLDSIRSGAFGYILKDADQEEFVKAINQVHQGHKYFSADISQKVVDGYLSLVDSAPTTSTRTPIKTAGDSKSLITKREMEILQLALDGLSNKDIAEKLGKSKRTVETHRFNLMKKLGTKNLAELNKRAIELGYI